MNSIKRSMPAWVMLCAGLLVTVLASLQVKQSIEREAIKQFAFACDQVTLKVHDRLNAYAMILRGGAALFAAAGNVSREDWRAYVATLRADENVPGVQGIGFVQVIPPDRLDNHVAAIRREGFPNYAVHPPGDRPWYTAITHLEPFRDRNLRAFGFDMFSEPVRRAAMARARDSGDAALSGKVELVQETSTAVQAGTLMYVPVYRQGAAMDTLEQRRQALIGWTFSAYRMNDLMTGILAEWTSSESKTMDLHIYDGLDASPARLLFESQAPHATDARSLLYKQRVINFDSGSQWLLAFDSVDAAARIQYAPAWATLIGGLAISGLLFGLLLSAINTRANAARIAAGLTEEIGQLNQRLSLAVGAAQIGVWEYLIPENRLIWDKQMYALYGVNERDFSGAYEAWQNGLHPDDKARGDNEIQMALAGQKDFDTEFRVLLPGGAVRHLKAAALLLRDSEGQPQRMIGVNYDITDRKQNEETLRQARDIAESANQAKSRFLATMSHEIRTPMNGILGMAQMLLMPDIEETDRQEYAQTILSSGRTLLKLLNDILDLSKVESGKLELESTALKPAQIIHETRALFSEAANSKGLRIETAWAGPSDQRYLGDPHRLQQMLANLVGNAIKFTAKGHVGIAARELERNGQRAVLEFAVTDTGIGIAEDKRQMLFLPFSQTDSSTTRQYGGSGLGLSIVRSLATLMRGEVGVESRPGEGSRFWFRISANLDTAGKDDGNEDRRAAPAQIAEPTPPRLSGSILVVEDNPTNRKVIQAMLGKLDLGCSFVEDGQQAVETISAGLNPDLVLMDCQMPIMDGFEATRRIRRWESENHQPRLAIVALTAAAFEEDRQRCIDAGMDDYLAKPIDMARLSAMLEHWLSSGKPPRPPPDAAASAPELGLPAFDEARLLAQLGGDRKLAKSIVQCALDDMPNCFAAIEQAVAAGNWQDAKRATHTLKGLAAQIGGLKLASHLKQVDEHLKRGGEADAVTLAALREDYQALSAALSRWLA